MEKRTLTLIFGCSGSGKSTLARALLGEERKTVVADGLGCSYTVRREDDNAVRLVALGRYTSACGGVDGIKPFRRSYMLARYVAAKHKGANILMESLLITSIFGGPAQFLLDMKYGYGFDIEVVFLYCSDRESLKRVFVRNGWKGVNASNIMSKKRAGVRLFKKYQEMGEFRCLCIDTSKITSACAAEQFKQWSKLV